MVTYTSFGLLVFLAILFIAAFAAVVHKMHRDKIDLSTLLHEHGTGKTSLSRFQLLLFTFVIAGTFLVLSLEAGAFVEIPTSVLILLGISGGSFVISKAISAFAKKPESSRSGDN